MKQIWLMPSESMQGTHDVGCGLESPWTKTLQQLPCSQFHHSLQHPPAVPAMGAAFVVGTPLSTVFSEPLLISAYRCICCSYGRLTAAA